MINRLLLVLLFAIAASADDDGRHCTQMKLYRNGTALCSQNTTTDHASVCTRFEFVLVNSSLEDDLVQQGSCEDYWEEGNCLDADTLVWTVGDKTVPMWTLMVGDMIQDADGRLTEVYDFTTNNPNAGGPVLDFYDVNDLHLMRITPNHVIYLENGTAVFASQVKVGDYLQSSVETALQVAKIDAHMMMFHAISPLTRSNNYVVGQRRAVVNCWSDTLWTGSMQVWASVRRTFAGNYGGRKRPFERHLQRFMKTLGFAI